SGEIDDSPAMMITVDIGSIRHTCTITIENIASPGSASQYIFGVRLSNPPGPRNPVLRRIQSMGLYTESSIHSQPTVPIAIGVAHGSRISRRTNHLPGKLRVSASAS